MNLQTYIEELIVLRDEHGRDLDVVDSEGQLVDEPEFYVDGASECIVICDKA